MMETQRISEATNISDRDSATAAVKQMESVPDYELHYYLVQRDTLGNTSAATRQVVTLAQIEYDRRTSLQARNNAKQTAYIGVGASLLGAVLGFFLSTYVKTNEPTKWQVKFTPAAVEQTVTATPENP